MAQGFTKDYLVNATGETAIRKYLTTQTRSSGTTPYSFTLPSGVKAFTVHLKDVSTAGTNNLRMRLGDSGGIHSTAGDYTSGSVRCSVSANVSDAADTYVGFLRSNASDSLTGTVEFKLQDPATDLWTVHGSCADDDGGDLTFTVGGSVDGLDSEVTTLEISVSADNWDAAGVVNVSYENPDLAVSPQSSGSTDVFINGGSLALSGTSQDFSGIPAGVKEVTIGFEDVGLSGSEHLLVQLGDSGGIESTGYAGTSTRHTTSSASEKNATGIELFVNGSGEDLNGVLTLKLVDEATNLWVCSATLGSNDTTAVTVHAGFHKALSGVLSQFRIKSESVNTMSGTLWVQWDNPRLRAGVPKTFGKVVQVVNVQDGEGANTTATIANDDSIPQNTEGLEIMTLAITPNDTNNKLKIEVIANLSVSGSSYATIALFQDSTAGALSAQIGHTSSNEYQAVCLTYWMTAGTVSSTTFKVRAGPSGNILSFNGSSSGRKMGGVMASSITITEYEP